MNFWIAVTFILLSGAALGQIHCGNVSIEPNSAEVASLTFDSFTDYQGGVTINSVATIRVRVEDQAIPDPDCRWFLYMEVYNNPGSGTPANEWETLFQYGAGTAPAPDIDILQIRVRNACQTSPLDGVFQTFTNDGDILEIIADLLPLTPAGSCATNVNGPGDYLTNYDEFTFNIDIRVAPGYLFSPGIYELGVKFHLEEQM